MENWICVTCGTQFTESQEQPNECPICLDQRQYVGYAGQKWTTIAAMRRDGLRNEIREHERDLIGIGTTPQFAIGQRALLLRSTQGNILWDCISLLDDATVAAVQAMGGIKAIAISHPHYYSSMVEWARRFDARIYLHEDDRKWVMRPDERITFWTGETYPLQEQITLLRLGGHFPGGTVLHWPAGAEGRGALLSGDIITVVADHRYVSFMYSYPNLIPLSAASVQRIRDTIEPWPFERLYGAWFERVVAQDAHVAVLRSAERYIRALEANDR
ncbi:MAG TPA: MBL fold metallo-hydrolase [Ktedonobacteraceae bacterium]|jgi:glyoxylase-like metal-dependent hydrolase (beta-lactamase superfamily II)